MLNKRKGKQDVIWRFPGASFGGGWIQTLSATMPA